MMLEFKRPKKSESTLELQQGLGEQMVTAVTNVIAESPCSFAIDVVNGDLLPRNIICGKNVKLSTKKLNKIASKHFTTFN